MDILIIDKDVFYRKGLLLALERIASVGRIYEAACIYEAVDTIKNFTPDVIFLDVRTSSLDGKEATQWLLQYADRIKIIAISMFTETICISNMIKSGAAGYIDKDIDRVEVLQVLEQVMSDKFYQSRIVS